jgi:hypothetical protein
MTVADKKGFDAAFNRLSAAGLIHNVDLATKRVYFETLSDLPLWAVELAEAQLRRTPVKFFTSAVWHQYAATVLIEQRRRDAVQLAGQKLLPQQCEHCQDTGMRVSDPTAEVQRLRPCECREKNRNYQLSRARQRMADDEVETPTIPAPESGRLLNQVLDFKQIGSGEK